MRRRPRSRRSSLWAGVYVGLFGVPSDEAEPADSTAATDEEDERPSPEVSDE